MSIFEKLNIAHQQSIPVVLCTIIESHGSTPRKPGTKMLVYSDGKTYSTIGGGAFEFEVINDALKALKTNTCQTIDYNMHPDKGMNCGGQAKVFFEPLKGNSKLYIFGGGHIGKILSELTIKLGFSVYIIDDRPEIIQNYTNNNITTICKHYSKAIKEMSFDDNTFICVVTYNHLYDKEIVASCSKKLFAYLGMLGSKNKIEKIKNEFTENNTISQQEMDRINWPMGINIACSTPEEIAVSILAKLVDERNKQLSTNE